MWILGLNGLNAIAHFPIFPFLHTSILDIITRPCKSDKQGEGIVYHLIFLIFFENSQTLKICTR